VDGYLYSCHIGHYCLASLLACVSRCGVRGAITLSPLRWFALKGNPEVKREGWIKGNLLLFRIQFPGLIYLLHLGFSACQRQLPSIYGRKLAFEVRA